MWLLLCVAVVIVPIRRTVYRKNGRLLLPSCHQRTVPPMEHGNHVDFESGPTEPDTTSKEVRGVQAAKARAEQKYMRNAVEVIRSDCHEGVVTCLLHAVELPRIQIPLLQASLKRKIQVSKSSTRQCRFLLT